MRKHTAEQVSELLQGYYFDNEANPRQNYGVTEMNISYSFTAPESLLIVAITALILLLAVCLVMFIDIWRKMRNMRRQKKRGMNTINSFSVKKM